VRVYVEDREREKERKSERARERQSETLSIEPSECNWHSSSDSLSSSLCLFTPSKSHRVLTMHTVQDTAKFFLRLPSYV